MAVAGRRLGLGKRYSPPGTAPGTLHAPEGAGATPIRVTVIDYGPEHADREGGRAVEEASPYRDTATVTWINVEGFTDVPFLESLGRLFGSIPSPWRTSSTAASGRSWRTTATITSWS